MRLLVVGGYGIFGGRIVQLLESEPRLILLVAGRSLGMAEAWCKTRTGAAADALRSQWRRRARPACSFAPQSGSAATATISMTMSAWASAATPIASEGGGLLSLQCFGQCSAKNASSTSRRKLGELRTPPSGNGPFDEKGQPDEMIEPAAKFFQIRFDVAENFPPLRRGIAGEAATLLAGRIVGSRCRGVAAEIDGAFRTADDRAFAAWHQPAVLEFLVGHEFHSLLPCLV
ncbi:hypothetical protein [Mesorhizobium sp. LSJC285A00]|uniref:hypothetical protein n=1 Tax=Mesorhizobium sp. LSJC285A00 TaxID=1287338 RepID=UPI0018DE11AC|nr:hypothetical protein [Mesorhizobium sp. LSJC285A00]